MNPYIVAAAATLVKIVLQVQALEGEGDGVPTSRRQLPGLQFVSVSSYVLFNHVHIVYLTIVIWIGVTVVRRVDVGF